MSSRLLTNLNTYTSNVSSAAINRHYSRHTSGIMQGILNECPFTDSGQNGVVLGMGNFLIEGHIIEVLGEISFSIPYNIPIPTQTEQWHLVAEINQGEIDTTAGDGSRHVNHRIFVQKKVDLIQQDLFANVPAIYQMEIGTFNVNPNQTVSNIIRTIDVVVPYRGDAGPAGPPGEIPVKELEKINKSALLPELNDISYILTFRTHGGDIKTIDLTLYATRVFVGYNPPTLVSTIHLDKDLQEQLNEKVRDVSFNAHIIDTVHITQSERTDWNAKPTRAETSAIVDAHNLSTTSHTDMRSKITRIEEKIPNQATSTNQLADKDFVNSTVISLAANRVFYDAAGNQFPTRASVLSATTFYRDGVPFTPEKDDYLIVTADEGAPSPFTGGQTRWKYSGTQWFYDFGINERPFTAAEQAALASGVTKELIESIANKVDKVEGKSLIADTEIERLAGISTGAQVNIIETIRVNGTELPIVNKTVDINIEGGAGGSTSDSALYLRNFITEDF